MDTEKRPKFTTEIVPDKNNEEVAEKEQKEEPSEKLQEEKEPELKKNDAKPDEIKKEKREKTSKFPFWTLFFAFLVGISLGAGVIGGLLYYRDHVENNPQPTATSIASPETTPVPSSTPTASGPSKVISKEIKISILNGSGIKGEAGRVEALLTTAGFKNLQTGNAKSYDYKETIISAKKEVPKETTEEIKSSLKNYVFGESKELSKDSNFDIEILVGSTKK